MFTCACLFVCLICTVCVDKCNSFAMCTVCVVCVIYACNECVIHIYIYCVCAGSWSGSSMVCVQPVLRDLTPR